MSILQNVQVMFKDNTLGFWPAYIYTCKHDVLTPGGIRVKLKYTEQFLSCGNSLSFLMADPIQNASFTAIVTKGVLCLFSCF